MRAARTASAVLCLVAFAPGARAADPETEKRVDRLVETLGGADGAARARATKELQGLGAGAVPLLVERIPDDAGSKRLQAVLDALAEVDVEAALAEIQCSRSEWGRRGWRRAVHDKAPPKSDGEGGRRARAPDDAPRGERWVDAVIDRLRARRDPSKRRAVPLEPGAQWDVATIPPWLAEPVGKRLPEALAGEPVAAREEDGGKLAIDLANDGKYATLVGSDFGRVVETGPRRAPRKLLVFRSLGAWFAAPAATLSCEVDGTAAEFLDADLDGAFDGASDLVRFGGGAYRKVAEEPTAWTGAGLVTWRVRRATAKEAAAKDAPAWFLEVETEPEPAWRTPEQAASMEALNVWRQGVGLPPQRIDRTWSDACRLHHEYWAKNGFSAHDEYKDKPLWTQRGAEAGKRSSVGTSPDGARFARDISWTILHRQSCVGDADHGMGAWAGPSGSLLWGPRIDATPRGFPILVPGPGQTGVPVACEPEIPVPDRDPKYYETQRGAPLAVTWSRLGGRYADLKGLRFELFADGRGEPLPGTLWSKENRYKADFAAGFPEESAIFCADAPLAADTAYVARFRATGAEGPVEIVWRFRTQ